MSKILVDRDELQKVWKTLDHLLEKGRMQDTERSAGREVYYTTYKLDEKEEQIVEYLKKNPDSTKEDVVTKLGAFSRVTILRAISRLLEKGVIITIHRDEKSRINNLYVNHKNAIFLLRDSLGAFQYSYDELIDKATHVMCSKLSGEGAEYQIKPCTLLFYKLLELYKSLCMMYITSDIFLWLRRPLNNETLHYKFEHFFNTMKKIHFKLLEIPGIGAKPEEREEIMCSMLCSSKYGFTRLDLLNMLSFFKKYDLSEEFELVVDAFWALSYPILPIIDPLYKKHQKNGNLKDWRHIFKGSYKPKTKQWFLPE